MGHGKLKKFAENLGFSRLLQPEAEDVIIRGGEGLQLRDHAIKGRWGADMFGNDNPIIVELGCGKGEYTIDLALRHPEFNYIGVDIKGARLHKGAKYAHTHDLKNVAFLRTRIEFIGAFFGPGEISEVWLTFSDPQMKSENQRLTSPLFLQRYRSFLRPGGIVHVKTDSRFLHEYSQAIAQQNGLRILASTLDLYGEGRAQIAVSGLSEASICGQDAIDALFEVQTYYERMFLAMGLPITYLSFIIDKEGAYIYPEFDAKYWREREKKRTFADHAESEE
ncbi:MAG: tRNA (guanosine(46)-N7)-methyltransferase TrmB [Bacteroidales bacterium]|nr:tRNA (guanosine(46)-N7)-methyltransferase TrmB [Bacteroidales bacterium]